jgi:hypothetical protein
MSKRGQRSSFSHLRSRKQRPTDTEVCAYRGGAHFLILTLTIPITAPMVKPPYCMRLNMGPLIEDTALAAREELTLVSLFQDARVYQLGYSDPPALLAALERCPARCPSSLSRAAKYNCLEFWLRALHLQNSMARKRLLWLVKLHRSQRRSI